MGADPLIMLDEEPEEEIVSSQEVAISISTCTVNKNLLLIPKEHALRIAASIIAQVDLM